MLVNDFFCSADAILNNSLIACIGYDRRSLLHPLLLMHRHENDHPLLMHLWPGPTAT